MMNASDVVLFVTAHLSPINRPLIYTMTWGVMFLLSDYPLKFGDLGFILNSTRWIFFF